MPTLPPTSSSNERPQPISPGADAVYDADNELTSSDNSYTVIGDGADSANDAFPPSESTLLNDSSEFPTSSREGDYHSDRPNSSPSVDEEQQFDNGIRAPPPSSASSPHASDSSTSGSGNPRPMKRQRSSIYGSLFGARRSSEDQAGNIARQLSRSPPRSRDELLNGSRERPILYRCPTNSVETVRNPWLELTPPQRETPLAVTGEVATTSDVGVQCDLGDDLLLQDLSEGPREESSRRHGWLELTPPVGRRDMGIQTDLDREDEIEGRKA
ncbi:MAG: hypothetical protein Q9222_001888 [Ikaeria aurantiellina]